VLDTVMQRLNELRNVSIKSLNNNWFFLKPSRIASIGYRPVFRS
jgi:hypothetical protein